MKRKGSKKYVLLFCSEKNYTVSRVCLFFREENNIIFFYTSHMALRPSKVVSKDSPQQTEHKMYYPFGGYTFLSYSPLLIISTKLYSRFIACL